MMPLYENIFISRKSPTFTCYCSVADKVIFSGQPDITLTWVRDQKEQPCHLGDFSQCITIGEGVYLESLNRLAFHCGRVKLTVVKRNSSDSGRIVIGKQCVLQGTAIVAYESVIIEDNVVFGPNVTLMDSGGHPLSTRGAKDEASRIVTKPVLIKEHSWIGLGAIILPGVTIGRHAVIGAGSVVRTSVPDFAVVAGNPAAIVKYVECPAVG